jgi:hypothetical protein
MLVVKDSDKIQDTVVMFLSISKEKHQNTTIYIMAPSPLLSPLPLTLSSGMMLEVSASEAEQAW